MREIYFKFNGNIENNIAVCNISECSKYSDKPNIMMFDASYCTESDGTIYISKKQFLAIDKKKLITYK